jgi:hypothetical protein
MIEIPVPWEDYIPLINPKDTKSLRIHSSYRDLIDHMHEVRPYYRGSNMDVKDESKSAMQISAIELIDPPRIMDPNTRMWLPAGYFEIRMVCRRTKYAPNIKGSVNSVKSYSYGNAPLMYIKLYAHPHRVKYDEESIYHFNKLISLFEDYTEIDIGTMTSGLFNYL